MEVEYDTNFDIAGGGLLICDAKFIVQYELRATKINSMYILV
jgi:hypothetical protein